jgi:hypothetical protein
LVDQVPGIGNPVFGPDFTAKFGGILSHGSAADAEMDGFSQEFGGQLRYPIGSGPAPALAMRSTR